MPVTSVNPQYERNYETWKKIDKVIEGNARQYIPDIEPIFHPGTPGYDPLRYKLACRSCELYRDSGIFINFSRQSLNTIVALALNAPPVYQKLPPKLEYLESAATGNGLSLDQLKQKLMVEVASKGRVLLFTDYAKVPTGLDAETQKNLNLGPKMYVFNSLQGINWKTRVVNGREVLSLVVIQKTRENPDNQDKFDHQYLPAYLVLELDKDGYYFQYELDDAGQEIVKAFYPLKNGKRFNKIPFTFIGSEDNDPNVDIAPLETIVDLNIGHYRNSCVYEDNLRKYGRGTLTITSELDDEKWLKFYSSRPIVLGTEEGYFLGKSGKFEIAQLQPAQEAAIAMDQKQEQLLMAGAHIVVRQTSNVSTETTTLNMTERVASLSIMIGNIEDALNEHIGYCAEFQGLQAEPIYINLSREFIKKMADPTVMRELLSAMNGSAIPTRIYLSYLQSVGIVGAEEDIEALIAEAQNENPLNDITIPASNAVV